MSERRPYGWRKGQTMFNFLEWLRLKGHGGTQNLRMADPFYIEDGEWDRLYEEFLEYFKATLTED